MLNYESDPTFREFADATVRAQASTGFPARVILTVAACESGWFKSLTGDFNYYGITRNPEDGHAKLCDTHEDITYAQLAGFREDERATAFQIKNLGGGKIRFAMKRWFASYASLDDSVIAYTEFFTKSPHLYRPAWRQFQIDHDESVLLKGICEAGYATGDAAATELAIEHQSNITHAIEMAQKAWNPPAEMRSA